MIYFTSDLHLGHKNIIKLLGRKFDHVDQMNEVLIRNINDRVRPNDTLYILGDLSFREKPEVINGLIRKIKCRNLVLIRGNHDVKYDPDLFLDICDFKEIKAEGMRFSLMHYPMVEWPGSRNGAIQLHGHQHNPPAYNQNMKRAGIRRYDVGVEANGYAPVSLEEILDYMNIK